MIYIYKALDQQGGVKEGTIDTVNIDVAINNLQKQGLIISFIRPQEDKPGIFDFEFRFHTRVSNKDVVILSRQLATLFDAQVSALRIFRLIAGQVENHTLRDALLEVTDDLQGGMSISAALAKHPKIFSDFYINMVRSGEESGKLDQTFNYLADYLDRTYEVTTKAKSALVYPAFVIATFIGVMILMLTVIIPKIGLMIKDSGQEIPFYTKIVLAFSDFTLHYGIFFAIAMIVAGFVVYKYSQTQEGARWVGELKLEIPYVGDLYRKLYLSRIADNMNTMILSGIPMLRALEITSTVVDNEIYKAVLMSSLTSVKGGSSLSTSLSQYEGQIPGMMIQMIKIGEETGELGNILKTLARFYQREVTNAVDTLVGLIEPIMIVSLGLGVGILLASVLMPIYNIASVG
jgi:type IV pilus assembly protein PilC